MTRLSLKEKKVDMREEQAEDLLARGCLFRKKRHRKGRTKLSRILPKRRAGGEERRAVRGGRFASMNFLLL